MTWVSQTKKSATPGSIASTSRLVILARLRNFLPLLLEEGSTTPVSVDAEDVAFR
jgi:hypothetical protein